MYFYFYARTLEEATGLFILRSVLALYLTTIMDRGRSMLLLTGVMNTDRLVLNTTIHIIRLTL